MDVHLSNRRIKPGSICEVVRIADPRVAHNNGRFVTATAFVPGMSGGGGWLIAANPPLGCACCDFVIFGLNAYFLRPITDPDQPVDVDQTEEIKA